MLKKLKEYFKNKKLTKEQKVKIERTKAYYEMLRKGVAVIQFIQKDLTDNMNKMPRMERRRLITALNKNGKFSPEMIGHYDKEFEKILEYINKKS